MYRCWIENEYSEKLELTNNKNYTVYQIDGLDPPTATINTSTVANFDGTTYNSSRANERNIVIYLSVEGDCEASRIELYKYAKSKRAVRFYYQNDVRNVYIDGYVESITISFFEQKQVVQLSVICPNPWFKAASVSMVEFSNTLPLFVFPFAYEEAGAPFSEIELGTQKSILNNGDIENGVVITLTAQDVVLNPAVYNLTKGETLKLSLEMSAGDTITIDTRRARKSITITRDGATSNIINNLDVGSAWFQLRTGDNVFTYGADEFPENLTCEFVSTDEFEGV